MITEWVPVTAAERANAALIHYPRFKELHDEIRLCQHLSKIAGEPQCMSLEGRTGAGKSTLVKTYARHFPAIETNTGRQTPVLYLEVPSPVGIRDLAAVALKRLGDPAYERGTRAALTMRLIALILDCGVELVILDDFHHLIDKETNHILAQVSDWLKYLIKETGVPFLVVGIEGHVEVILQANPQLSRLFAAREALQPFVWDPGQPATCQEFSRFVEYTERAMECSLTKELPRLELLSRIHRATEGVVGNVMNLMRVANEFAGQRGQPTIELEMLALAYAKRLQKHLNNQLNPFADVALVHPAALITTPTELSRQPVSCARRRNSAPASSLQEVLRT